MVERIQDACVFIHPYLLCALCAVAQEPASVIGDYQSYSCRLQNTVQQHIMIFNSCPHWWPTANSSMVLDTGQNRYKVTKEND